MTTAPAAPPASEFSQRPGRSRRVPGSARECLSAGCASFNHWRTDAVAHFDAALERDPSLAAAHAAKGLFLCGGRNRAYAPVVDACAAAARAGETASDNERRYVEAVSAHAEGRIDQALVVLEAIALDDPLDLFAQRVVQQELFWLGEVRRMRAVADRAAPAWHDAVPGYATFLAVRAFGHEETGDLDSAERLAREAVEREPSDCWGAHALAHVLEMRGSAQAGAQLLRGLSQHWGEANQIAHHLWWHYSLFALELGETAQVLETLDERIRNPASPLVQAAPDLYIDIQNVASLLMRLELRGVDVGQRWHSIADVCAQRAGNHASVFTSAHAAMTLAAAGRDEELSALLASMEVFAADRGHTLSARMGDAGLPAARGAVAHRRGDYASVVEHLMPARHDLWRMGGSHAQRDLFFQLLVDACRRLSMTGHLRLLGQELRAIGFRGVELRSLYGAALKETAV